MFDNLTHFEPTLLTKGFLYLPADIGISGEPAAFIIIMLVSVSFGTVYFILTLSLCRCVLNYKYQCGVAVLWQIKGKYD